MGNFSNYPAIFYKEDDGGYSVIFPDLKGANTSGDNLQEAMSMAVDCLAGYIYGLQEDGDVIPPPSDIHSITDDVIKQELDELYDKSRVFVNIISVNVAEYAKKHFNKAVVKTVTIPLWMAEAASAKKLKLSHVLQEALREKLSVTK